MGRIVPPPPMPGETGTAYQLRLITWYRAQLARDRLTLTVIWAAVIIALFIVLVVI